MSTSWGDGRPVERQTGTVGSHGRTGSAERASVVPWESPRCRPRRGGDGYAGRCGAARGEGLDRLRSHESCRPESRSLAPRGQKPSQRCDLRVQLLRAPQRLCLPVLAVTRSSCSALVGPRLLILLLPPPGFGLHLSLLLPLRLGPDADKTSRPATHVLHALPKALAVPTTSRNQTTPVSDRRLAHPLVEENTIRPSLQVNVTRRQEGPRRRASAEFAAPRDDPWPTGSHAACLLAHKHMKGARCSR